MYVELSCPSCPCTFRAAPEEPAEEVIRRMTEVGPWFGLAPGDTFEDMVLGALTRRGLIHCPDCRDAVCVSEASFGRNAAEALAVG
jgi:hypothetical protein